MMQFEENISEDKEKNVDSVMTMKSEETVIKDKEKKEDNSSKASPDVSSKYKRVYKWMILLALLSLLYIMQLQWYKVEFLSLTQRDEQIALLLDVVKCDKSEVRSIYQFCDIGGFYAFMTKQEANKFAEMEAVVYVGPSSPPRRQEQTKSRRKIYTRPKIKKQKLSIGSILSEKRKNREKWIYNEDLELKKREELEEESEDYYSSDSSGSSEIYFPFDEFGKRWYRVSLVHGKRPEDQQELLLAALNCDESEISSIHDYFGAHHLFEAYMTEEEADKVAGLDEVESVEPRRVYIGFN